MLELAKPSGLANASIKKWTKYDDDDDDEDDDKIRETTTMTKIQHDTIQINNGIDATEPYGTLKTSFYRISEIGAVNRQHFDLCVAAARYP